MRRPYTEHDTKTILDMRTRGETWSAIAQATGRSEKTLYAKFSKMKKAGMLRKPYIKRALAPTPEITSVGNRPMVAFIGTPKEITQSIRELFS